MKQTIINNLNKDTFANIQSMRLNDMLKDSEIAWEVSSSKIARNILQLPCFDFGH